MENIGRVIQEYPVRMNLIACISEGEFCLLLILSFDN